MNTLAVFSSSLLSSIVIESPRSSFNFNPDHFLVLTSISTLRLWHVRNQGIWSQLPMGELGYLLGQQFCCKLGCKRSCKLGREKRTKLGKPLAISE
jgi:hypothetical protein